MATRIEPEIFSREIVKPFSSGVDHPKSHTLTIFDEFQPPLYVSLVYFYSSEGEIETEFHRSYVLKKSLSTALSLYYPLAGKRNCSSPTIDCNDEGVLFLEARICCSLSEVLRNRSLREETVNQLFPDGLHYKDCNLSSPLVVQATYFDCGGMAIAICISHSLMDMSSICCFFNKWASLARNSCGPEEINHPEFNIATLFPTDVYRPPIEVLTNESGQIKLVKKVTRTFVFDDKKIAKLKSTAEKEADGTPTRLEVVQALLFKSAVSAAARARSSSGLIKPATLNQPVNMRTRVHPPLPETATGNFTGSFSVTVCGEEISKLDWIHFVGKIRNEKHNYLNELAKNCRGEELIRFLQKGVEMISNEDKELYFCSNWCRFPLYDADFGWGKPSWVTPARYEFTGAMINVIQMLDSPGGDGMEVMMVLEEHHMNLFESDEELLAYATVS